MKKPVDRCPTRVLTNRKSLASESKCRSELTAIPVPRPAFGAISNRGETPAAGCSSPTHWFLETLETACHAKRSQSPVRECSPYPPLAKRNNKEQQGTTSPLARVSHLRQSRRLPL